MSLRGTVIYRSALLFACLLLTGCETLSYYTQSISGHARLMRARQPIDESINHVSAEVKGQLLLVQSVLQFAEAELGLKTGKSYRHYVDLPREFPVWVVFAAPEFSLQAKNWCYLVIGCAAYRGYFKQADAERYAARLIDQGWDVEVVGSPAYSTLGWFADPVLSSMIRYGRLHTIETLLHELAHQQFYVKGDSGFNEAFATAFAIEATLIFLQQYYPQFISAYRYRLRTQAEFSELLAQFKTALAAFYATMADADWSLEKQRAEKQSRFNTFVDDYHELRNRKWKGQNRYPDFMDEGLNNARLVSYATYHDQVRELRALFVKCETHAQFVARLKSLSSHDAIPASCHKPEAL